MLRGLLTLILAVAAVAQPPQQTPLDATIQAYRKAHSEGRFDEAVAKRESALALLTQTPPESPQFGMWVLTVSQMYSGGGMYVRSREIVESALARTGRLGDSHPTRIMLLNAASDTWRDDRNLLKALTWLEKATAAIEAAPPAAAENSPNGTRVAYARLVPAGQMGQGQMSQGQISFSASRVFSINGDFSGRGPGSNLSNSYQRLAELNRQLGRPQAAAAALAKMKALEAGNNMALASFYERQGNLDEAAALYQKQVTESAGNPQQAAGAMQQLAYLYQREQRFTDAAAALTKAVATLDASGVPGAHSQALNMRQNLASMLQQAGQTGAADQVYQQLMAENQNTQDPNYLQVLMGFANYLGSTKRGAQADALLTDYADNHPQMEPWQESNLLFARASSAREAGDNARAEEYQKAAMQKNQATQAAAPDQNRFMELLQKAQMAVNGQNLDDAFSLAMQALGAASNANGREQVAWQVPNIATGLAGRKASAKAEQLYQQLFGVVQSWSADNMEPLLNVTQSYPRFLMSQKDRQGEVPEAIERYRKLLVTARGPNTGHLQDALQITIEFERLHGSAKRAVMAAQDMLTQEESLSGVTSEPYLNAVQGLAELYESTGDADHAVRQWRQAVTISDLVFNPNDGRRPHTRMRLAILLANQKQFDDAEKVAAEAVAIGQQMHPPQEAPFTQQLDTIRKMKSHPSDTPAGSSHWFAKGVGGQVE